MENGRTTFKSFRQLLALLAPRICEIGASFRKAIPVQKRVVVSIWRQFPTVRCSSKFLWQLSAISSLTLTSFCFIFSLYSVFLSLSDFEIIKLIVNSLSAAFIEMPLKKENLKNAFFRVWVPKPIHRTLVS